MASGRMLAAALVLGWVAGACAPAAPEGGATAGSGDSAAAGPSAGAPDDTASGLIPSLDVTVDGDSVLMTLHLTSAREEPVVLEFPSAQRSDFQVRRDDGTVVWTWSADKMFAQAIGTETVAPGETLEWSGAWPAPQPGRYEAIGRLVSSNRPVEITVPFEVR